MILNAQKLQEANKQYSEAINKVAATDKFKEWDISARFNSGQWGFCFYDLDTNTPVVPPGVTISELEAVTGLQIALIGCVYWFTGENATDGKKTALKAKVDEEFPAD